MQAGAVGDCRHAELAHAVVHVVAAGVAAHAFGARPQREVGAGQVGRAAEQFGQPGCEGFDGVLAGLAGGDGLGLVADLGQHGVDMRGPVGRQRAAHAALEFGGQRGVGAAVGGEARVPLGFGGCARFAGVPGGVDVVGHFEGRVIPANIFACGGDLGVAQRRAVHIVAALLVGGAGADHGLAADQRRLHGVSAGLLDGGLNGGAVVALHIADHLPAVGFEALRRVVGEPAVDMAVDGDVVVVVEGGQFAQAPGAGKRTGFVRNAFHQAAVAEENPGAVVDDGVAGAVEVVRQHFFGQRHADGVGDALAERAGGGFDARRVAVFGVAGRLAVQLTEILQIVDRQIVAGQVQQGVDQHRAVTVGQHEAVAVGPLGVGRVVLEVVAPQHFGDLGHAHGGAGVAGLGFLNRIHGQRANRTGDGVELGQCDVALRRHRSLAARGPDWGKAELSSKRGFLGTRLCVAAARRSVWFPPDYHHGIIVLL